MANTGQTSDDKVFVGRVVEAAIRLGLLVLLVTFCFLIIEAFIAPALWGIVIAVGIYPFYGCGSAARPDLWRGSGANMIPTPSSA